MTFAVKTSLGIVAGFNNEHLCVTFTDSTKSPYALKFYRKSEAQNWINDHVDAGFGLNSSDVEIVDNFPL